MVAVADVHYRMYYRAGISMLASVLGIARQLMGIGIMRI